MISSTTIDYVLVPFFFHFSFYWVAVLITYLVDSFRLPKHHINWSRYGLAAKVSLRNQFTISLPTLYLLRNQVQASVQSAESHMYIVQLIEIVLLINVANLFFYWSHRLLHVPLFFRMIHAQHHEFMEPIGVAAMYAHPLEHLISNTLSFLLPLIVFSCSYRMMLTLLSLASFSTVLYHTPSFKFFSDHLVHHQRFKTNFGFGRYLDEWFGTSSSKEERVSVSTISSKDEPSEESVNVTKEEAIVKEKDQ